MSLTGGLKFKKLDLQVHTPKSPCFVGDGVTPEAVVEMALRKGLDGIAITDHNTGAWVDRVKEAAKGHALVVFPGLEILVQAGKSGIHVLALLDVNKGSREIEQLVGALKLKDVEGVLISQAGVYNVIDIITNDIHNGLAILAHCTGPKGALSEMSGIQRTSLFQHPNLLAVDVGEDDFLDPEKTANKTRAIDLLDGNHQEFSYRKLAVIQTSDNPHATQRGKHGLEGIGNRYTCFKLDDHINLEGLRLCFVDRDTRIRQSFEYKERIFPNIKSARIKGGFLDGAEVTLHQGLNCVLGAKGAGKSLLIEFLRFALDQQPTQQEILDDHEQKLEERLQRYGEISVVVADETGKDLTVTRSYNPADDNPYKEQGAGQITRLFPVLFLSQNEIIRIAENEEEQLRFIDRFFDFRSYQARIQELEQGLKELDREFANCLRAYRLNRQLKKEMAVLEKELETIAAQMKNPVFDEFAQADSKERSFQRLRQFLAGLESRLKTIREQDVAATGVPALRASVADDPALKRLYDLCVGQRASVLDAVLNIEKEVGKALGEFDKEYAQWKPQYDSTKRKYDEAVQAQKGDYKALEQRRLRLSKDRELLAQRLNQTQVLADKTEGIKKSRDASLGELNETYKNYRRERLLKCKKFEADSAGKLSVLINESTNVDVFKQQLTSLKRGSYLSDEEIEKVCGASLLMTLSSIFCDTIQQKEASRS